MIWQLIGILAASLTTFAFVPQVIKIYKTKSARDISVITLIQLAIGTSLWIVYGLYRKDAILIMANIITFTILLIALFLYRRYSKLT